MTIFERALEFVTDGMTLGLGTGRAAERFLELLGMRVRNGLRVRGVATSEASAALAARFGIPLVTLEEGLPLDLTVDGADEVDPQLNVIKGYGRALVREKIVAAASKRLVLLVGREKLVPTIGSRGKLPVEVVPFASPFCLQEFKRLGIPGVLYTVDGRVHLSDNGNHLIDCKIGPTADPVALELMIHRVPGVVDTGLFLNRADTVLVGAAETFELQQELHRPTAAK